MASVPGATAAVAVVVFLSTAVCQAASSETPSDEVALGYFLDQQTVATEILVLDEQLNAQVSAIGLRLAQAGGRADFKFTFRVVSNPIVNAYATAAGFIYINSGLLDVVDSPDELAAVLAHEMVHINESHLMGSMNSAYRRRLAFETLGMLLGVAAGVAGAGAQPSQFASAAGDLGQGLGNVVADVSIRGYKKKLEIAADEHALEYMVRAGYDPYATIRLFKRLEKIEREPNVNQSSYASALINKQPGLQERERLVEAKLELANRR